MVWLLFIVSLVHFVQAPEVYESQEYKYTDVFALGMVIFFMLTGERPFAKAVDAADVQLKVTRKERPDLAKLPVEYREMVSGCWEHG
jgi:serine/threonine protein kinase